MVIIVPALAEAQQGDPEAVPGTVRGLKATRSPHVGGGIYEPGPMQANYCTEENPPRHKGKSTQSKENYSEDCKWNPVPFADPDVEFVLAQIRDIGKELGRIVLQHLAGDDPADVSPEAAIAGRMRVTFLISVLVMEAMGCDPENGTTFKCESGADSEGIFHPFGSFVTPVREEPMVAHTDAEADGNPPQKNSDGKGRPTEEKQRSDSADMKDDHKEDGDPGDGLGKRTVAV